MAKPVSKTTAMSSFQSFLIILLISMVISTPPSSFLEDQDQTEHINHTLSTDSSEQPSSFHTRPVPVLETPTPKDPPSAPSSSVLEDQDQTEHINHTLSTDSSEQPSSFHTRPVPVLETPTPTASSLDTLSSSSPSFRTPTNAEKPIHTNFSHPASSLHNGTEFPRDEALDMSVPPASNPSPSFQTHRIPQPFLDVNYNSDLLQTSTEATMVIHHTRITLIPDYLTRITKHHDDIAESSHSQQHEEDEEYVIVDERVASEDPYYGIYKSILIAISIF